MTNEKALTQVKEHVHDYFADHLNPDRIYHNLQHTREIVNWTVQLGQHYNLDSKSRFIVEAAAWFSNLCYDRDPKQYQERNARYAQKFLRNIPLTEDLVKNITGCILSTRLPQQPKNTMEEIACDAHMYHLGLDDYEKRSKLIRKELVLLSRKKISKDEWKQRDLELLQNHRFKTEYAKQLLDSQQQKNLELLKTQKSKGPEISIELPHHQKQSENATPDHNLKPGSPEEPKMEGDPAAKRNKLRPDRGIETMFKISSSNHQALSQMADSKAHIMITVNSIIISVLLSVVFRSLDNEPHLAIPVAILLLVNVITIVFSILATRPNIPSNNSKVTAKEKVNLLFFGNYYKMNLQDFSDGMMELMEDRDFLYGSLIKNLHSQGLVLSKKYKLLRISYNIFMYGLVMSILAFGLAILLKGL